MTIDEILKTKGYRLTFKSLKKSSAFGICDDEIISIDLKTRMYPAKTFIHEVLHYRYPTLSEKQVIKAENSIWKSLTYRDILKIYRKMFKSR